jgi:hypothetical protein
MPHGMTVCFQGLYNLILIFSVSTGGVFNVLIFLFLGDVCFCEITIDPEALKLHVKVHFAGI